MDLWKMYDAINSSTAGRDSVFRLVQYSGRLLHSMLEERKCSIDAINRCKNVESSFSLARKFLRLFRMLEMLDKAVGSLSIPDALVRTTTSFSYINTCLYYLTDHVVWFGRTGIGEVDNSRWTKHGNKFWLISVVMNLTRLLYQFRALLTIEPTSLPRHLDMGVTSSHAIYHLLVRITLRNRTLILDLVKNLCDFFMIMAFLGSMPQSGKVIGVLGVLSSLITILSVLVIKS